MYPVPPSVRATTLTWPRRGGGTRRPHGTDRVDCRTARLVAKLRGTVAEPSGVMLWPNARIGTGAYRPSAIWLMCGRLILASTWRAVFRWHDLHGRLGRRSTLPKRRCSRHARNRDQPAHAAASFQPPGKGNSNICVISASRQTVLNHIPVGEGETRGRHEGECPRDRLADSSFARVTGSVRCVGACPTGPPCPRSSRSRE